MFRLARSLRRYHGGAPTDEVKLLTWISLAKDHVAAIVFPHLHPIGHVGNLGGRELLEQLNRFEELGNDKSRTQHDIGHDSAVDHVHDTVGKLQNPVIMRDYDNRAA